jgi:ABC-type transport system substrate-binding protein
VRRELAILSVCGVLLATGMAVLACTSTAPREPATSAITPPLTVSASTSTLITVVSPSSPTASAGQRAAFLAALDHDGVPRSKAGDSEVLIGRGVCGQLAAGRSQDAVAAELSDSISVWNHAQALSVVRNAQLILC